MKPDAISRVADFHGPLRQWDVIRGLVLILQDVGNEVRKRCTRSHQGKRSLKSGSLHEA
jgi:hypothetical protein